MKHGPSGALTQEDVADPDNKKQVLNITWVGDFKISGGYLQCKSCSAIFRFPFHFILQYSGGRGQLDSGSAKNPPPQLNARGLALLGSGFRAMISASHG